MAELFGFRIIKANQGTTLRYAIDHFFVFSTFGSYFPELTASD
jgi:hypothetical protein